jgi:acetyl-CoA carboxylase biotin carboxyl carrier protein
MAKTPIDNELIRSLATLLNETGLSEIEYEAGGLRVRVARQTTLVGPSAVVPAPSAPVVAPAPVKADPATHPGVVISPMVGVVYMAPEPGAPRFVSPGDPVSEGQTLLLIEAMKTFNPIRAPRAGKLGSLLVEDGQPVEYGEPLLIIE